MPDDKYPQQKQVVPFGFAPKGDIAYEPYKQGADGDDHSNRMTMYWDFVADSFFKKGNRWSAVTDQLRKMYAEITDQELQELSDQVQYYLEQYNLQIQSSARPHFHPALGGSTVEHEGHVDEYWGHDTSDNAKMYECPKGSNQFRWEGVEKSSDYGLMDGPGDIGRNHDGDFPNGVWLPRGQEDQDADPNVTTAAVDSPLTIDQQNQVAAKYGPEYNSAVQHFYSAVKNHHPVDRSFQYAMKEMTKIKTPVEPTKFMDVIDTYLSGLY